MRKVYVITYRKRIPGKLRMETTETIIDDTISSHHEAKKKYGNASIVSTIRKKSEPKRKGYDFLPPETTPGGAVEPTKPEEGTPQGG